MKDFNYYPVFKKRDGQTFKEVDQIFAQSFEDAKKIFAENMTKDNWDQSNNIQWLTQEDDGVETGWYDFNCSDVVRNEDGSINLELSTLEEFCLEKYIKEGFDNWSEDVYTWEVRNNE